MLKMGGPNMTIYLGPRLGKVYHAKVNGFTFPVELEYIGSGGYLVRPLGRFETIFVKRLFAK